MVQGGQGEHADTFYQAYVSETEQPVSKRCFGITVKNYFKCPPGCLKIDGVNKRAYIGISFRTNETKKDVVPVTKSDEHISVSTGDVKNKSPVSFQIHVTDSVPSITLFGKSINHADLGLCRESPINVLTKVLSKTKLCKGYESEQNTQIWSSITSPNDEIHRTMAPKCKLIIVGKQKKCVKCRNHQVHLQRRKDNHPISSSSSTTTGTPPPSAPQPLSAPAPQSLSAPDPQPLSPPAPQSLLVPDPQSLSAPDPQSLSVPDPQSLSAPAPQSLLVPDPQSLSAPAPQSLSAPDPQSLSAPDPQSLSAPDPQSLTAPDPQSLSAPDPQLLSTPDPQSLSAPDPQSLSAPDTQSQSAPDPQSLSAPDPQSLSAPSHRRWNEREKMSEKASGSSEESGMSTRKSARGGVTPVATLVASVSAAPSASAPTVATDTSTFSMTTRAKTDPEGALRKRHSITSMFKAANVQKAEDGSLIYRRRQSTETPKKKARTAATSRMSSGGSAVPVSPSTSNRSVSPATAVDSEAGTLKRKRQAEDSGTPTKDGKKKRTARPPTEPDGEDGESDFYCWLCHKEGHVILCELCPRVYHIRCLGIDTEPQGEWVCPECEQILRAECEETRSKAMSLVTIDQLCTLMRFALSRMKCQGSEPFQKPVDTVQVPEYTDYVFKPMCLSTIEKNIRKKQYGSTEALLADTKWILHNCILFNGASSKLTSIAKSIVKICSHEMSEIEICPDCYFNSCTKRNDNWFCEPCRSPHTLVWAKMKGYPFWPAKALREVNGQMDARFFGEHDRAWVPVNQVFLLSKEPPTSMKSGRKGFDESMQELELHIEKIRDKFGSFNYAPFRMPYDPDNPYLPSKVKTPDRSSSPASSTSPSPQKAKRRILSESPTSRTATSIRQKYTLQRKSIITTRTGGEREDMEMKKEEEEDEEMDYDEFDDPVPEGVEESQMEVSVDETETETKEGNSTKDQESSESPPNLIKDSGVFTASKESGPKPAMEIPPVLTQVAPLPKKLTIVNKLAEKLSALEEDMDKSETKSDESETKPDESETKSEESKTKTESKTETEKVEETANDKDSAAESQEPDKDSEILREIMVKAKEHETEPVVEKEKVEVAVKPNPFLSKLVESCKEKLGISEDELKDDSSPKEKDDEEDDEEDESDEEEEEEEDDDSSVSGSYEEESEEEEEEKEEKSKEEEMEVEEEEEKEEVASKEGDDPAKPVEASKAEKAVTETPEEAEITKASSSSPQPADTEKPSMDVDAVDEETSPDKTPTISVEASGSSAEERDRLAELAKVLISETDWERAKDIGAEIARITCKQRKSSLSTTAKTPKTIKEILKSNEAKASAESQAKQNAPTAEDAVSPEAKKGPANSSPQEKGATDSEESDESDEASPQAEQEGVATNPIEIDDSAPSKPKKHRKKLSCVQYNVGDVPEKVQLDLGQVNVEEASTKLMGVLQSTLKDMCATVLEEQAAGLLHGSLQDEIERLSWKHEQELNELRHNMNLTLHEMRATMDTARETMMQRQEKLLKDRMEKAVEETKKKQWCANCPKEASFYCCWNTSYCNYPCQQSHWPEHMGSCTQEKPTYAPSSSQPPSAEPHLSQPQSSSSASSSQPSGKGDEGWKSQARQEMEQVLQRHTQKQPSTTAADTKSTTVLQPQPPFTAAQFQRGLIFNHASLLPQFTTASSQLNPVYGPANQLITVPVPPTQLNPVPPASSHLVPTLSNQLNPVPVSVHSNQFNPAPPNQLKPVTIRPAPPQESSSGVFPTLFPG